MILGTRSLTHAAKQRQRFVAGQIFTSIHTPPIQIEIDPAFLYIGNVEFEIKAIAHVDRHVFVDAQKQRVKRMIILQFEGFLDNNYKTYSNLPHHPINLGGETFGHDNYFFSIAVDITTYPGAETDHTLRLLQDQGYRVEDEQMTSRFARVVDTERRHELLIFYHENVSATGLALATIAKDDIIIEPYNEIALEPVWKIVFAPKCGGGTLPKRYIPLLKPINCHFPNRFLELTKRSLQSFRVLSQDPAA